MIQLSPIFRMTTASFSQSFAVDSTFPENLLELLMYGGSSSEVARDCV